MKKIYTLFISLLFGAVLFAADARHGRSRLTIKSLDNDDIKVMIDGKRFDPRFNSMMLENLRPGFHRIKVFKERDHFFDLFNQRRYDVVYNSTIHVRPGTHTLIRIDRFNRTNVEVRAIYRYNLEKGYDKNRGRDGEHRDWNDYDHHYDFDTDGREGDHRGDRDGGRDDEWNDDDRFDRAGKFAPAMRDDEFAQALQSIGREWFEKDKLAKAKQTVDANRMTSSQVKQMVQLFSFENSKLELAKYAYGKTVDKQNYYILDDVFSFNNSKKELDDYERRFR